MIGLVGAALLPLAGSAQMTCNPCSQSVSITTSEIFKGCLLGGPFHKIITAEDIQVAQPFTVSENVIFQVEYALTKYIVRLQANITCTNITGCEPSDFKLNRSTLTKKSRSPAISVSTGPSPCETTSFCSLGTPQEIFRGEDTAGVSGGNACSTPGVDGAVTWRGKLRLDLTGWDVGGADTSVTGTLEAIVEDETP